MAKYYAINVYMYVLFPVLVLFLMQLSSGAWNFHNTLTNCNEAQNDKILSKYTGNKKKIENQLNFMEVAYYFSQLILPIMTVLVVGSSN